MEEGVASAAHRVCEVMASDKLLSDNGVVEYRISDRLCPDAALCVASVWKYLAMAWLQHITQFLAGNMSLKLVAV